MRGGSSLSLFILRRLALVPPSVAVVTLLLFLAMELLPGDAVHTMLADSTHSRAMQESLRTELGLDRPWYERYLSWVTGTLDGSAASIYSGEAVSSIIRRQLPPTLLLASYVTLVSIIVSIPLGIVAAVHRRRALDRIIRAVSLVGLSTPAVFSALLVLVILLRAFRWSPPIIYAGLLEDPATHFAVMWAPLFILSWEHSSHLVRITRSTMIDTLSRPFIAAATARGQSYRKIVLRYGFRNSLLPPVTALGLQFGSLLGGAIVLESVFGIPGIGRGIVQAALARDVSLLLTDSAVLVTAYLVVNIVVDTIYLLIDPRLDRGASEP